MLILDIHVFYHVKLFYQIEWHFVCFQTDFEKSKDGPSSTRVNIATQSSLLQFKSKCGPRICIHVCGLFINVPKLLENVCHLHLLD